MQSFTPRTLTSKTELRREIRTVREKGLRARPRGVRAEPVLRRIPVPDHNGGAPLAAISIAMPKMRFKKGNVSGWCSQMREKATLITQQLGLVEN